MRAQGLTLAAFGEPARLTTVEIPVLAAGRLLIEVRAASINAFDGKVADGALRHAFEYDFPVTIGRDYAGVVTAVGAEVTRFRPGDAVFGNLILNQARANFWAPEPLQSQIWSLVPLAVAPEGESMQRPVVGLDMEPSPFTTQFW